MTWILMLWACPSKPVVEDTGTVPKPNPCEGVEGTKKEYYTAYQYGDVTMPLCRSLNFGNQPVLVPYRPEVGSASLILGSNTRWYGDDGIEDGPIVYQLDLVPDGDAIRLFELQPGVWTKVGSLGIWAATTGDTVDIDGDGFDEVIVVSGDDGAALSAFADSPSATPVVESFQLRVFNIGDINGDGHNDIARFVEALTDPKDPDSAVTLLNVQPLPVDGPLADQEWAVTLGDSTYTGEAASWDTPDDGLVRGGFDHNGDGVDDIVLGESLPTNASPGSIVVFNGPILASRSGDEADATLQRDPSTCTDPKLVYCDVVGSYQRPAGDLNVDGYDDLVIGADRTDYEGVDSSGAVWVLSGPLDGFLDIDATATATIVATDAARLPADVFTGGDLDADGWLDMVVTRATVADEASRDGARLMFGPFEGVRDWTDGAQVYDSAMGLGQTFSIHEDLDGDGIHDMVMVDNNPESLNIWYSTLSMQWPRPGAGSATYTRWD